MRVIGVDPGLTRCGVGVDALAGRRVPVGRRHRHPIVARSRSGRPSGHHPRRVVSRHRHPRPKCWPWNECSRSTSTRRHGDRSGIGRRHPRRGAGGNPGRPAHAERGQGKAVTGNSRADKQQLASMVMRLLRRNPQRPPHDASDALALAICHAWRPVDRSAEIRHPARQGDRMIEYVRGSSARAESHVVIDVGGIGIRVEAAPATGGRPRRR